MDNYFERLIFPENLLLLKPVYMRSPTKKSKDFVQDATYAVHFGNYRGLLKKLLNHDPKIFNLDKDAKIVDVGCGFGDLLKTLRDRNYKNIMGVEPDLICRKACLKAGLDVKAGTISETGLPNSFADVVIVNQVFHHIKDFNKATDELARILKSNGILCFLEPSPTPLRKLMDIFTFKTPLPKYLNFMNTRFEVMKLEMATGLYPNFLSHQKEFSKALNHNFYKVWHKQSWFFQFGKYKKKS